MKKKFNKKLVWLLVLTLLLCIIPAAYVLAKTVAAQEAETVFFYVTNADGKEILVRAAPIDEIRKLSHPNPKDGENYANSSIDSLPTICYAEAQGFTTDELIQYLNQHLKNTGSEMGQLTYKGQDIMRFMADDSMGRWTRYYTAEELNGVERKYVKGLYDYWNEDYFDYEDWYDTWYEDFDLEYEETLRYKAQAWAAGEEMPALLSPVSNSGRVMMYHDETSAGIAKYVEDNGGVVKGCLRDVLDTDKALTLYIPTSEDQFMKGERTTSENFKWIFAIKLDMEDPPTVQSKGTVPAAVPTYELIESGDKTLLKVTLTSPMDGATIYYNDGTDSSKLTAQTKYEEPFTIDVTGKTDENLSSNPIKYYTRTVREGYDDKGQQEMYYYQSAPKLLSFNNSPFGKDVVFTADDEVTQDEWSAWTNKITKITLGYPDKTSEDLTSGQYRIDNENKTITFSKDLFETKARYNFTIEAAEYATLRTYRNIKDAAPEITMAASYPMNEDIVLTFDDPTQGYHSRITVKINGKSVSTTYLDRSEPGKLTIKANYFDYDKCVLKEPGEYTLELTNTNYGPDIQTLTLIIRKVVELTAGTVTGNPGDTVEVPIALTSSGEVAGGMYDLSFDSSLLTYKQTVAGDDIATSFRTVSNQLENGDIRVLHNRLARENRIPAGTVVIAVIQFEVAAGASPGAACALELTGVGFHDGDRVRLPVTANNGQFSVPETPPALASDTTDNTVGQAVEITFTDNEAWRSAISGVKVNGTALPAEQYTISAGKISIAATVFTEAGTYLITVQAAGYNDATVTQMMNRSAEEELAAAKTAAKNELDSYKNPADYRQAQKDELAAAVAAGKNAIDAAVDIAGVNSALATAKAAIDEIKTDAQLTAEELAAAKTEAKDELESYNNAADYREAQKAELAAAITAGKSAIDAAADIAGVNSALAAAKAAIDEIKTDAQLTAEELAAAKGAAKNELDNYKDPQDYRKAQQAELAAAITAGKSAIDAAADIAGVNSALADAKAAIDKIKTDAQLTAEELAAAKGAAKNELDNYKHPNDYSEAQQAELAAAIAAGKSAIDAAVDIEGVHSALAAAKAAIDEIKTDAQLVNEQRLGGDDRYATAVKVSQAGWTTAGTVILARGDDFADAVAGVPFAHQLNAPILLTQTNSIVSATIEEITRLKAERVIVLGGPGAISDDVMGELEGRGLVVERIQGADRYETAFRIAECMVREGAEFDTAIIAVGTNFADALAASSYAAMRGQPILLTDTNYLPQATKDAISNLGIKNTVVCGGPGAVSESVFAQLPNPKRVYGNDRYLTALELAKEFMPKSTKHVYVATGLNFPDAVAGGVLAAKNNSGVLLVQGNQTVPIQQIQDFYVEHGFTGATMFGGSSVVSSELEQWFKDNSR
jgi:putative cell wall-binding protein